MVPPKEHTPPRRGHRPVSISAGLLALLALGLIGWFGYRSWSDDAIRHAAQRIEQLSESAGAPDAAVGPAAGSQIELSAEAQHAPRATPASATDIGTGPAASHLTGQPPARSVGRFATASSRGAGPDDESEVRRDLAIAGTVLDDAGRTLPGIAIAAHPISAGAASGGMTRSSDGLGMFRFEPLEEGEYRLGVEESADYLSARINARAGTESIELRLQRRLQLRIAGTVSDPAGQPLAQVVVSPLGESQQAQSDALGQYEIIAGIPRAGLLPVLQFTRQGYRQLRQRVRGASSPGSDLVFVNVTLQPENGDAWLAGRILGPSGEPVPGATVVLQSPVTRDYHRDTSGGDGGYRFDGVEIGAGYRLIVPAISDYAAYRSESFALDERGAQVDAVLDQVDFGTLVGQAIALDGTPLSGFTLWLSSDSTRQRSSLSLRTDGAGRFEVEEFPAGIARVDTRSHPRLQAGGIRVEAGARTDVVVPLDWGPHWLLGRVTDEGGQPVAGARLVLQWSLGSPQVQSSSWREAASDQQGYFAFSNLGGAPHTLTVQAPEFRTFRREVDPGQVNGDVLVALKRDG